VLPSTVPSQVERRARRGTPRRPRLRRPCSCRVLGTASGEGEAPLSALSSSPPLCREPPSARHQQQNDREAQEQGPAPVPASRGSGKRAGAASGAAPAQGAAGRRIRAGFEIGAQRWRLANGVRVILKPTDFKDDEIVFRAWSPGGSSLASDEGYIAAVTAVSAVAQGGAGDFSLVDLQKALAGKAVRVSPYITSLSEGFSGNASPSDVETLFQLIYLYFTAPRRDEDAFQSLTTRMQAFLANRSADPVAAYRDTIQVTMAQNHFRARPASAELYQEMDLDKSLAFYRDRFADASDFAFVFVGSFDPDTLEPLIRTYLGGLPSSQRVESWRVMIEMSLRPMRGRSSLRKKLTFDFSAAVFSISLMETG